MTHAEKLDYLIAASENRMADARKFAEEKHSGQMHGIHPYSVHLRSTYVIALSDLMESSILRNNASSITIEEVVDILCACFLHNVIEDTGTTYNDVVKVAGVEVADIVYDVTDELGKNRKERKERTYPKIASNPFAIYVKLCDRISNTLLSMDEEDEKFLNMHRKEYPEFRKALMPKSTPFHQGLWKRLDDLMPFALSRNAE